MAVPQKCRQLFAGFEVLDEMLDSYTPRRTVAQRKGTSRVPRNDVGGDRVHVEVDETFEPLRATRDVDQQFPARAEARQAPAAPRQHGILAANDGAVEFVAQEIEQEP